MSSTLQVSLEQVQHLCQHNCAWQSRMNKTSCLEAAES